MLLSLLTPRIRRQAALAVKAVLPYVLGAALVTFLWWHRYQSGYDDGVADVEAEIQKAVQAERLRQIEVNNAALEAARQRIEETQRIADERERTIQGLLREGAEDPNADRPAIGPDSVRRLNRQAR